MDIRVFESHRLRQLLKAHDVAVLSLFGSSVRGEENSASDIDLLVRFNKRKGLLAFVRLERELGALLGKKVDLVTENSISPFLRERILQEARIVYDEKER